LFWDGIKNTTFPTFNGSSVSPMQTVVGVNDSIPSPIGFGNTNSQAYPDFSQMFMNMWLQKLMSGCMGPSMNYADCSMSGVNSRFVRKKLSPQCMAKINAIAKELNFNPQDLLKVIYSESGGDPHAVNRSTGATGLIQFMPKTAQSLGTSVAQLRGMSAEQQLDYVYKYLSKYKRTKFGDRQISKGEVYALVACPGRANKGVLYAQNSAGSRANRGLTNRNGQITTESLARRLDAFA
jgi:hypothetical protein